MADLSLILTSPKEVVELIEDCPGFCTKHNLDPITAARAANFSAIATGILQRTPTTITDLSDKMSKLGGFLGGSVAADGGFTDNYTNGFTDNYSNSRGAALLEKLKIDPGQLDVTRIANIQRSMTK